MRKVLACLMLLVSFAAQAQNDYLDEQFVNNGIRQIQESNYNYFTNEGWDTSWGSLSSWYADVLVTNQEAKNYLKHSLNMRAVYDRFNELNYRKHQRTLRYSDIDAFNRYDLGRNRPSLPSGAVLKKNDSSRNCLGSFFLTFFVEWMKFLDGLP